jgi:hypothetical protein
VPSTIPTPHCLSNFSMDIINFFNSGEPDAFSILRKKLG